MIRFAETQPQFTEGQLVRHVRYGYRGVVVAVDPRCMADQDWYMRNRTQPDLNQPWYHVLLDGCATTTYAAETSLAADHCSEPIDHPLVDEFFTGMRDGRYVRNDRKWRGWQE